MNIYVSNLSFNVIDDDLLGFFEEFGKVASATVIMDKFTKQSKGFGFVVMPDDEAAKIAIQNLNGATADNRTIRVTEARPKEDRNSKNNRPSFSGSGAKRW